VHKVKTTSFLLMLLLLLPYTTGTLYAAETVEAPEVLSNDFSNDEYKHRYKALRCTMCQNQNIKDSNASIARDMRRIVYEQIEAGKTDEQITQYLVDRFGTFVLYKPPFKGINILIWILPFVILLGGFITIMLFIQKKRHENPAMEQSQKQALKDALSHINE
jgi:cytochrome c-type biogenesis protein CcmH